MLLVTLRNRYHCLYYSRHVVVTIVRHLSLRPDCGEFCPLCEDPTVDTEKISSSQPLVLQHKHMN